MPVLVLVFSFASISDTTVNGNKTMLNDNKELKENPCSVVGYGFNEHLPVRFAFNSTSPSYVCTWSVTNNALRLVLAFISVAVVCLCFFFTFIRRSRNMYLFGILIAAIGVGFGYIGVDDARDVAKSNSWCQDNMTGVKWGHAPETIVCQYTPFILVSLFDFITAACWILLSFFAICFVCKAGSGRGDIKSGRLLPDDGEKPAPDDHFGPPEEEDTPDAEAAPKKKSGGGGGLFNFFGRNKSQRVPDEPDPSDGQVNFEKESNSRFAPMSKTDREAAKDLPLGKSGGAPGNSQTIGNALFNFDEVDPNASAAAPKTEQPTQPAQPVQPAQPQQPQQPKASQGGGVVDFEALAGNDDNPFAV